MQKRQASSRIERTSPDILVEMLATKWTGEMAANCKKVTGIKTHSVVEEAHDWLLVWICHWLGTGLQEGDRLAWAKRVVGNIKMDWFQSQWLASTWWSTQVAFWKTVWWIWQDPDSCNWELFHNMLTVPQSQSQSANVAGFELEESQSSCTPRARLGSKKKQCSRSHGSFFVSDSDREPLQCPQTGWPRRSRRRMLFPSLQQPFSLTAILTIMSWDKRNFCISQSNASTSQSQRGTNIEQSPVTCNFKLISEPTMS